MTRSAVSETIEPQTHTNAASPPRAFAQGTGVVLQVVGGILLFSSCCVCSVMGSWDPTMTRSDAMQTYSHNPEVGYTFGQMLQQPGKLGVALHVATCTAGGLGMMVFGLGLQAEKRRSGWGAVVATAATALFLLAAAVLLWTGDGAWAYRIWNLAVLLVVAVLCGFSVVALRQMLRCPPPADLYTVPADYDPKKDMHGGH